MNNKELFIIVYQHFSQTFRNAKALAEQEGMTLDKPDIWTRHSTMQKG